MTAMVVVGDRFRPHCLGRRGRDRHRAGLPIHPAFVDVLHLTQDADAEAGKLRVDQFVRVAAKEDQVRRLVPVLVGAFGGARWGASAIPQAALAHVDILPRVRATAEALVAGWVKDGS